MAEYDKMYYALCDGASRAIDALEEGDAESCLRLLKAALAEAENIYIATCGNGEEEEGQ